MLWTELERIDRIFDPFRELDKVSRSLASWAAPRLATYPAVNVLTNADGAVVTAELPGIETSDVDISVKGSTLTLKVTRRPEKLDDSEFFHLRERWHGEAAREIGLPFEIEREKVSAKYVNGVLTVTVPRAESAKPRKIAISSE